MTSRIKPLAAVRQCSLSEPMLRHIIACLEEDADMLDDIALAVQPHLVRNRQFAQLSRLNHVLGHLQGYAEGLKLHLPTARPGGAPRGAVE